ncbi:MAG: hypothetical protein JWO06_205 [Bacteroidota bacterium]|nr:hypothetical protein [Bacteroidota bacterium]
MLCPCNPTNPVPACAQNIILGAYTPGKQLNIYFTTATGRVDMFTTTVTSDGIIQLPTPDLRLSTPYTVTIAETDDQKQTSMQWIIDSTSVSCLTVTLAPIAAQDNCYNPQFFQLTLINTDSNNTFTPPADSVETPPAAPPPPPPALPATP